MNSLAVDIEDNKTKFRKSMSYRQSDFLLRDNSIAPRTSQNTLLKFKS